MHYTFTIMQTERLGSVGGISGNFGIFQFQIPADLPPNFLHSFNPLATELEIYSLEHHLCKLWI
jgi:hypothetical protein